MGRYVKSHRGPAAGRYVGPFNRQTANPVLVASTTFDSATRYEAAQFVAELLPNSHLLTVEGWGHSTLFLSRCANRITVKYLIKGILPENDSVCRQDIPPFRLSRQEAFEGFPSASGLRRSFRDSDPPMSLVEMEELVENRAKAMRSIRGHRPSF